MELIDTLFSTEKGIVEKLKEFAIKPNYKEIIFEHLGPELKKLFILKKDKIITKNFLEAVSYEYGFFDKEIDLQKAFSIYKKNADLNDYFCMYKMHVIYLCEYEKFNVAFDRVLEKIYLFKCLAYLPNYVLDWRLKFFEKIDVLLEVAQVLDLEDVDLEKHILFFDLLYSQNEKYNLSQNDIALMKGVFSCYFYKGEDPNKNIISFSILNSLIPSNDFDKAYYVAKNKCVLFRSHLKLESVFSEGEIDNFYKEVENKSFYELYSDYGNYLIDKIETSNPKIIDILSQGADNGDLFSCFRVYQALISFYDFEEIMNDYDKACKILDYLLDEIVFEKLMLSQFILLMGYLIEFSKNSEKIMDKYLVYIKELNDFVDLVIYKKEVEKEPMKEKDEHYFFIKAYIYYYGFKNIEKQNLKKAVEYLDKGLNISDELFAKRRNKYIKYEILSLMKDNNLISNEELNEEKKNLTEFINSNMSLKYEVIDNYILGQDFYQGITGKIDEYITLQIYQNGKNVFCKSVIDFKVKSKIKSFIKNFENKIENKFKDEICCICYEKKVIKIFVPCGHYFCTFCAELLLKEKKCPVCRSQISSVI